MVEPKRVTALHPEVPCAHPVDEDEAFGRDNVLDDIHERFWAGFDDEPPDVVA
jgi:hypothetical protein